MLAEIEENLGKPITRLKVTKSEYASTVANTLEPEIDKKYDWQALIDENEVEEEKRKKKKKKKRK